MWRRGRIGLALVGVDLVGPAYQVGLGVRDEELGVLEEVLGVSVSTTLASGKKYLSHLWPSVRRTWRARVRVRSPERKATAPGFDVSLRERSCGLSGRS